MADNGTEPKKFQTRAGISRKSKEEREQYARDEAVRQQQRIAESALPLTRNAPERGKAAGRGRPNALSTSTTHIRSENVGGVFGAAAPSLPKPRGGRPFSGVSVASEDETQSLLQKPSKETSTPVSIKEAKAVDDGNVKSEKKSTTRPRAPASKKDEVVYVSSEEDGDEESRRDIEQIWISSDEEAISSTAKGKQREKSSARRGPALRPLRAPRDCREEGEALSARNRVLSTITKTETGPTDDSAPHGSSAKEDDSMETSDKVLSPSSGGIDKKTSKRKSARLKDAIAVTETVEEHAERMRYDEEVHKLVGELNPHRSTVEAEVSSSHTSEPLHGRRLYLFQFPPMTPVLADPAEETEVKQEPDVEVHAVSSASDRTTGAFVKKEEGVAERTRKSDVLTADNMQLPSGLAGILRVHKSGKVTLDWGGTDLEVRYGTEVDFLQDVVMTDEAEQIAWALGQVEKKMVCIPNWQKLYE